HLLAACAARRAGRASGAASRAFGPRADRRRAVRMAGRAAPALAAEIRTAAAGGAVRAGGRKPRGVTPAAAHAAFEVPPGGARYRAAGGRRGAGPGPAGGGP